jgi:hypothetical protein
MRKRRRFSLKSIRLLGKSVKDCKRISMKSKTRYLNAPKLRFRELLIKRNLKISQINYRYKIHISD